MPLTCEQTSRFQSKIIKELDAAPDIQFKREWTEFEVDVLRKYYGRKSLLAIGRALGRSPTAVSKKAISLGIKPQ